MIKYTRELEEIISLIEETDEDVYLVLERNQEQLLIEGSHSDYCAEYLIEGGVYWRDRLVILWYMLGNIHSDDAIYHSIEEVKHHFDTDNVFDIMGFMELDNE